MKFTSAALADKLAAERDKNMLFFENIAESEWDSGVYTDGAHWTIHQILTHVTEAEDSVLRMIKHIAAGGAGVPVDFDLDGYNERKVQEQNIANPTDLLRAFSDRRERTVEFVRSLTPEQLLLEGRHPFLGQAALVEMIKLMYRYVQLHQRDIRKRLKINDTFD